MTPKVLLTWVVLLWHLPEKTYAPKCEKWSIFGAHRLKKGPHRRFGGSKCVADFWFENYSNKKVSHFSGLSLTFLFVKWTTSDKTLLIPFSTKKWPHIMLKKNRKISVPKYSVLKKNRNEARIGCHVFLLWGPWNPDFSVICAWNP